MSPRKSDHQTPVIADAVASAFDALPSPVASRLMAVRELIYTTAGSIGDVGPVTETLKWGQPSYAPARPRVGTPIRLGMSKDGRPALFVHCQTNLIERFREQYGATFAFEGNRALLLTSGGALRRQELSHVIAAALTYHLPSGRTP